MLYQKAHEKGGVLFKVGDLVVYGNMGVCVVDSVGPSEISSADKDRDYYCLTPVYSDNSRIHIPCDSEKLAIRAIMTETDAQELIASMHSIVPMEIVDEKNREQTYKEIIKDGDCRQMVSVIKTIYRRKQERIAQGKKITVVDEKYFKLAEDKLYGELAVALDIDREKMKGYIKSKVGKLPS